MPARFYVDLPLTSGASFALPPGPARHVQVLRLQPGAAVTLFDGRGGEWDATVQRMGRSEVVVQLGAHHPVEREIGMPVTLALGMPANERMDTVVEKATELGVTVIQPLLCERSVLRLSGERAQKKVAHWQAVALAACEQCGRTRVPEVATVLGLSQWLATLATLPPPTASKDDADGMAPARWMLSFDEALPFARMPTPSRGVLVLSGPEGGLTPEEERAARSSGFAPVSLGARVLRADTAPLAVLAVLALTGVDGR